MLRQMPSLPEWKRCEGGAGDHNANRPNHVEAEAWQQQETWQDGGGSNAMIGRTSDIRGSEGGRMREVNDEYLL
jgi:hypothetical protein